MISVAMATYNGEKYLRAQLDSIRNQSVPPDEIVISDDCSTDCTAKVVREFSADTMIPVRFFENTETTGFIRNFHNALAHCEGDIIFLSDQDDLWMPDRIKACVDCFRTHPEVLSLSCRPVISDEPEKEKIRSGVAALQNVPLKKFLKYPAYPGMALAVRGSLAREMLEADNTSAFHDWLLNFLAAQKNGMYHLDMPLVIYRQHASNTVGSLRAGKKSEKPEKRAEMLSGIVKNISSVYGEDPADPYVKKLVASFEKRSELLMAQNAAALFYHDITHLKYLSLKSMAGDLYALI